MINKEQKKGATVYKYTLEGLEIVHLGDLGHVLTDEQVLAIGNVDILFVPCGGGFTIGSEQASQVVEQLGPKIVIPMHYRTPALFVFKYKFEKVENLIKLLNCYEHKHLNAIDVDKDKIADLKQIITLDYK